MKYGVFGAKVLKVFLLFCFAVSLSLTFSTEAYSGAATMNPLGTAQDTRGDVLRGNNGGGPTITNPLAPTTTPTVPSAADITAGINSGLFLEGLQGTAGMAAQVAAITAMFDSLPDVLLPTFLDALLNSDLIPSDITNLLNQFNQLSSLFNDISSIACGGGASGLSQSTFAAFAQNSLASQLDPGSLFSFAGPGGLNVSININIDPAGFAQQALGGLANNLCPGGAGGLLPGILTPPAEGGNVPSASGPAAIQQSDCSSNWQSQRANIPAAMQNPELLTMIRDVSFQLGMDPNQLAGVIWTESGGDPTAINTGCPTCTASGLIQWLRSTANSQGIHNLQTQAEHRAYITSASISTQGEWIVDYYRGCGWQAGMPDSAAYLCVHAGNPHGNAADGVSGNSSSNIFNTMVLPRMEAFRCQPGGFDWNTMTWTPG